MKQITMFIFSLVFFQHCLDGHRFKFQIRFKLKKKNLIIIYKNIDFSAILIIFLYLNIMRKKNLYIRRGCYWSRLTIFFLSFMSCLFLFIDLKNKMEQANFSLDSKIFFCLI